MKQLKRAMFLDETQQHDEAFTNLDQAYLYGKERAFQGSPRDVLKYDKEQKAKQERNRL